MFDVLKHVALAKPKFNLNKNGKRLVNHFRKLPHSNFKVSGTKSIGPALAFIKIMTMLLRLIASTMRNIKNNLTNFHIKTARMALGKKIMRIMILGGLIVKPAHATNLTNDNTTELNNWTSNISEKFVQIEVQFRISESTPNLILDPQWKLTKLVELQNVRWEIVKEKQKTTTNDIKLLTNKQWYRNISYILSALLYVSIVFTIYLTETESDTLATKKVYFVNICAFAFVLIFVGGFIVTERTEENFNSNVYKQKGKNWIETIKKVDHIVKEGFLYSKLMTIQQYEYENFLKKEAQKVLDEIETEIRSKISEMQNNKEKGNNFLKKKLTQLVFTLVAIILAVSTWFVLHLKDKSTKKQSMRTLQILLAFSILAVCVPSTEATYGFPHDTELSETEQKESVEEHFFQKTQIFIEKYQNFTSQLAITVDKFEKVLEKVKSLKIMTILDKIALKLEPKETTTKILECIITILIGVAIALVVLILNELLPDDVSEGHYKIIQTSITIGIVVSLLPTISATDYHLHNDEMKADGVPMGISGNLYMNNDSIIWISDHVKETKDTLNIKCPCFNDLPDDPSAFAIYCAVEQSDCTKSHRMRKTFTKIAVAARATSFAAATPGNNPTTISIIPVQLTTMTDNVEKTGEKLFDFVRTNLVTIGIILTGWYFKSNPILIMGFFLLIGQHVTSQTIDEQATKFCQWESLGIHEPSAFVNITLQTIMANGTFKIANQGAEIYTYLKNNTDFPEEEFLRTVNSYVCSKNFTYENKFFYDGTFILPGGSYDRDRPFCYHSAGWDYVSPLAMKHRHSHMIFKYMAYPNVLNKCVSLKKFQLNASYTQNTTKQLLDICQTANIKLNETLNTMNDTKNSLNLTIIAQNQLIKTLMKNVTELETEITVCKNRLCNCTTIEHTLKNTINEYFALHGRESLTEKMFKLHMHSVSEEIITTMSQNQLSTKKLIYISTILLMIYYIYSKPVVAIAILFTCTLGYARAEDCASVERSQLITGTEIANVYISISSGQCQLVTTQEGAMFQVHLSYANISSGIINTAVYPRKGKWDIKSDSRCPGAGDSICDCKDNHCVYRRTTIDRGWGNGCFLFGAGSVCTSATLTPSDLANDWIYEYTIDPQNVVAKMIITDGTSGACYRKNQSIWQVLPGQSTCSKECLPRASFSTVPDARGLPPNHAGTRCYLAPNATTKPWCFTGNNTFCDCSVMECTTTRELAVISVGTDLSTVKTDIRGFGIVEATCNVKTIQKTSMHYMYIFNEDNSWDAILYPMSGHAIWSATWGTDKRGELREVDKAISFHGVSTDGYSYNSHFPNVELITKGDRAKIKFTGSNVEPPKDIILYETVQLNCRLAIDPKVISKPASPCIASGLKMYKKSETTLTVSASTTCTTRIFGIGCTLLTTQITLSNIEQELSISCEDSAGQICIDTQCLYMRDPNPYQLYVKAPVMNILSTTSSWMRVGGGVNSLYGFGNVLATKLHAAFSLGGITNAFSRLITAAACLYFATIVKNDKLKIALFVVGGLMMVPTVFSEIAPPSYDETLEVNNENIALKNFISQQHKILEKITAENQKLEVEKLKQEIEKQNKLIEELKSSKKNKKQKVIVDEDDEDADDDESEERFSSKDDFQIWEPKPNPSYNVKAPESSENPAIKMKEETNFYVFGLKTNANGKNVGFYHLSGCTIRNSYSIGPDTQHRVEINNCPAEGFTGPMVIRGNEESITKVLAKQARAWYTGYLNSALFFEEPKEAYHHCIDTNGGQKCNKELGSGKELIESQSHEISKRELIFKQHQKNKNQIHFVVGHTSNEGDSSTHHVAVYCLTNNNDLKSEINKALTRVFSVAWNKIDPESRHITWRRGFEMTSSLLHFKEYVDEKDISYFERSVSNIIDKFPHKDKKKANNAQRKKAHEAFQTSLSAFIKMFPDGGTDPNTYLHYLSKYPTLIRNELAQICSNLECSKYLGDMLRVVSGSAGEMVFRMINSVFVPTGNA